MSKLQHSDIKDIVKHLDSLLRPTASSEQATIALHEPEFDQHAKKYVNDCLSSGWVSTVGQYVNQFEQQLCQHTGSQYAIATSSGTAALHICLLLNNIKPNDEVLVPNLTFVATANAVQYCHAIPHFVDVEQSSLGIDAEKLRHYLKKIARIDNQQLINKQTGNRISALIVMHSFGHPSQMHQLQQCCQEFGLKLIEDAAESLGSYYQQQHTGNFSNCSALSFNGNKIITTGGGGAILTNDEPLAKQAKHLTTTAKISNTMASEHDQLAYNYRLPNLNAALGVAQLEAFIEKLNKKRQLAHRYQKHFDSINHVSIFHEAEHCQSNYWLNLLLLESESIELRDNFIQQAEAKHIITRPAWAPMHSLAMHKNYPRMDNLEHSISLFKRLICLPSSAQLMEQLECEK